MKNCKLTSYLVLILVSWSGLSLEAQNFVHPGMLHTQDDFDRIVSQLAANNADVMAGYNNLKNNEWSQSNVGTSPSEIIIRGGGVGENYINAARGAVSAYQNALRWKISGDKAHADRAVDILNTWAHTTTALGGNSNVSLASGLYGYSFANAAELLRDYEGWSPSDFEYYQKWMLCVWYPYCIDFLKRRHGTWSNGRPGHYWSNWGLCNVLAVMSIGILCDDVFIYNQGVSYYKYDYVGTYAENRTSPIVNDGLNEFLGNLVPITTEDNRAPMGSWGQMQESGRDQGHTLMALGLAVDICEIAWNQGDDLYAYMDNRLLGGIEYVAAYNSGIDSIPWTEYWYHDVNTSLDHSWKQTEINESSRGQFRPYWDRILGHYEGRKGIVLNYAHDMANQVTADAGGSGSTSGGYDHLGYSTLMCTRSVLSSDEAPITITPTFIVDHLTYKKGEMMNVKFGDTLKLVPLLPDDEVNTGDWVWSDGTTGKDLTIIADTSCIYRVYYTNSNGVLSHQLFSVAVLGDCMPDFYTSKILVDGETILDTVVTVLQNSTVKLSIESSSWRSSYLWSNGDTTSSIELDIEDVDQIVSVMATNQGGSETQIYFHIYASRIGAAYCINNESIVDGGLVLVSPGDSILLKPKVKLGNEGGTWLWSDSSTADSLVVIAGQVSSQESVIYTVNGETYTVSYDIRVIPFIDECVGYWPLDDGDGAYVYDIFKRKNGVNNGVISGNGYCNKGIKFNGDDDSYISFSHNGLYALSDFTISVWVNPSALDGWARIWDFGTGTSTNMFLTTSASGSNKSLRFAIKVEGSSEQIIDADRILDIGKWSHIAVCVKGSLGMMYLNGVEVGRNDEMTYNFSDLGVIINNYLGKSQYDDPMYKGSMDELRIFNYALSSEEVNAILNLNIPVAPDFVMATSSNNSILLNWDSVAGATGYSVRRSDNDGGPYSVISSDVFNCNYVDSIFDEKTYYYVISALYKNVEGAYSDQASVSTSAIVNAFSDDKSISIFPNPFSNSFVVDFGSNQGTNVLKLYTINGEQLKTIVVEDCKQYEVDMSLYPVGIYIGEIIEGKKKSCVKMCKLK